MAKLFKRTIDYYLATWVCLVAIIGTVLVWRHTSAEVVSAIVGIGVACATSIYGSYMLRVKLHAVADLRRSER